MRSGRHVLQTHVRGKQPGCVQKERVRRLNSKALRQGKYVLLWVQQDVRSQWNHALEHAVQLANGLGLPLVAVYGLHEGFPSANERSFAFLVDGLRDLQQALHARGVRLIVLRRPPPDAALLLSDKAAGLVCDCGYSRVCRSWRRRVAEEAPCAVLQVETSVIVPVQLASECLEVSAATFRPKIRRLLPLFLIPLEPQELKVHSTGRGLELIKEDVLEGAIQVDMPHDVLSSLEVDRSVPPAEMKGGEEEGQRALDRFIRGGLSAYRNGKAGGPAKQSNSFLSPYLHFGHISALQVALAVNAAKDGSDGARATADEDGGLLHSSLRGSSSFDSFLEELIVRRELARNFVWYLPDTYDGWDALPVWAQETLSAHEADPRPALYTISQLERGETSDSYWNAAQWQMVVTGHMHNYMRMYWCKRLLEWTPSARTAMEWATHLNDKYELDGRDENGYMGIAWCFGLHDRPFPEKAIYGTVRSMSHAGLARKFDMGRYESLVKSLCLKVRSPALLALLPKQARTGIKAFFAFWGNGAASLKKWILQAAAQG